MEEKEVNENKEIKISVKKEGKEEIEGKEAYIKIENVINKKVYKLLEEKGTDDIIYSNKI